MEVNYRNLCIELFGTDDEKQLRKLAQKLRKLAQKLHNNRNAGRKKMLNDKDVADIRALLGDGVTVTEIARRYNTTRPTIYNLIKEPRDRSTMQIRYMFKNRICTVIDVDFLHEKIDIVNFTEDILHRAFGAVTEPTWKQFEEFLAERCFPATRGNIKALLKELGLTTYDPLQIVEKTAGRTAEDELWMQFQYFPGKGAQT